MKVLYRAGDIVAVEKPAGLLSQGDRSGDPDVAKVLKAQWEAEGERVPFLAPVHRLDRNTSGVLILAASAAAARKLTEAFQSGTVEKTYLAVVKGDPGENGRYEFPLAKDEDANQAYVSADGRPALTLFSRRDFFGNSSLVEVRILTGRSHQIRAHFAEARHPLLGDRKYAKKPWSEIFSRPALHAHRIRFTLPGAAPVEIESALPDDMRALVARLGRR